MQTTETITAEVLPFNEVAELIDREVHNRTLEQINFLAREYEIRNPPEVAAFLSENKSLIDLLEAIPTQIRKHFGAEQKLKLLFFLDPEDVGYHRLYVLIPTQLSVTESSALLEKFDQQWWLQNERKSFSKILVDLEFVK